MRSVERNLRTRKPEKIVGGAFDAEGGLVEDQSQMPTDVMTPLGTICNLLSSAAAKGEKTHRLTTEERDALIEANLGQLRRAVTYWTGSEEAAEKIDINLIKKEAAHIHNQGRVIRALARSLVRLTAVPHGKQEAVVTALTNNTEFRNILQIVPSSPQYMAKEDIAPVIGEHAREIVEQIARRHGAETNSVWREQPPTDPQVRMYLDRANQEGDTGLAGVAMRVFHKTGALESLRNTEEGFKFPSDALVDRLQAAQKFYETHRKENVFVIDEPFKTRNGVIKSFGFAASKMLLALSPEYEEFHGKKADLAPYIDDLKQILGDAVGNAAARNRVRLGASEFAALNGILNSLDAERARSLYKEAVKLSNNRKQADTTPRLHSEPSPPDQFARLQAIFSGLILSELNDEAGTLREFVQTITDGRISDLKVTGVWRDPSVSEIVRSLEDGADIGRERARVEQLINNLPKIAEQAAQKRTDVPTERKFAVRIVAQSLYELAAEMRLRRSQDTRAMAEGEKATRARETARQNEEFARTYRMFVEYGLVQPRPEPMDLLERTEGQTDQEYDRLVVEAVAAHERGQKILDDRFRAERKNTLFNHLTDFLDHIDDTKSLSGNMTARIGAILGKSGKSFKEAVREKMQEIQARPPQERFSQKQKPEGWSWADWNPYVVYDQKTGKLLQPPEQMRESIMKAEELATATKESLAGIRQEFNELSVKVRQPGARIKQIDVNHLNVLEDKCRDPFTLLVRTQEALKRFGTDPRSLRYRSTKTTIDRLNGAIENIRHMYDGFASMRKDILMKFVRQTRAEIEAEGGSEEDNKELLAHLNDLEFTARSGKNEEVRQAINFFMYTE